MGPTWGPPGADRTQVGPMLTTWTLLSGWLPGIDSNWRQTAGPCVIHKWGPLCRSRYQGQGQVITSHKYCGCNYLSLPFFGTASLHVMYHVNHVMPTACTMIVFGGFCFNISDTNLVDTIYVVLILRRFLYPCFDRKRSLSYKSF